MSHYCGKYVSMGYIYMYSSNEYLWEGPKYLCPMKYEIYTNGKYKMEHTHIRQHVIDTYKTTCH